MSGRHRNYGDEPVMVWGWDSRVGRLIRLEFGMAGRLRDACHGGLITCPIADCSSPVLTTRGDFVTRRGTVVVDGFRHRVAPTPGHAPESMAHITAKLMISDWLRTASWDVEVERTDTRVARRPDVHAVKEDARLAIEVQYSQLPYSQWHQRTKDLASVGSTVIWLWGLHTPTTVIELSAIHQGELVAGLRLWWIDAVGRRLGVPFVRDGTVERSPVAGDRTVRVEWVDLDEVTADGKGFTHAWSEVLDAGRQVRREQLLRDLHAGIAELVLRRSQPKPARRQDERPPAPAAKQRQRWDNAVPRLTVPIELPPIDWQTASARERVDWYREAGRRATAALHAARQGSGERH